LPHKKAIDSSSVMDIKDGELVLKASGWDHLYIPAPTESKVNSMCTDS
jgi:uncharacterized protein (AIM24 family)